MEQLKYSTFKSKWNMQLQISDNAQRSVEAEMNTEVAQRATDTTRDGWKSASCFRGQGSVPRQW